MPLLEALMTVTAMLWSLVGLSVVQVEFWKELAQPEPNFHTLEALGSDIATSIQLADSCFGDILRLSPHSLPALRSYAKFLLEVCQAPWSPSIISRVAFVGAWGTHGSPKDACCVCCTAPPPPSPPSTGRKQPIQSPANVAEGRGA